MPVRCPRLANLPGATVHGLGTERCGIVTFAVAGRDPAAIKEAINVSVTRVASTRLDMESHGFLSLVRASVHYYNDDRELDRFITALAAAS